MMIEFTKAAGLRLKRFFRRFFYALFTGAYFTYPGKLALAPSYPKAAGIIQLISCVAGFIAVSLFWIFSGILLLIGAGLAFFGRKARPVTVE